MRKLFLTFVLCSLAVCVHAAPGVERLPTCWKEASGAYGIPVHVLQAIAFEESRFNTNAYNRNSNGSYDIGLMQINSSWLGILGRYGITEAALKNPCTNVKVGAWVLSNNVKKLGWNWNAIGAYNVGCAKLGRGECERRRSRYAWKIYRALMKGGPEDASYAGSATGVSNVVRRTKADVSQRSKPRGIVAVRLESMEPSAHPAPAAEEGELAVAAPAVRERMALGELYGLRGSSR